MDAQNFQLTRSYCQKAELNEYSVHGVAVKDYLFSDNPVGIRLDLVTQVVERKKKDDDELAWKKGYYGPSAVWDQPLSVDKWSAELRARRIRGQRAEGDMPGAELTFHERILRKEHSLGKQSKRYLERSETLKELKEQQAEDSSSSSSESGSTSSSDATDVQDPSLAAMAEGGWFESLCAACE